MLINSTDGAKRSIIHRFQLFSMSLVIALDRKIFEFLRFIIRRQGRSNEYRSIVIVMMKVQG